MGALDVADGMLAGIRPITTAAGITAVVLLAVIRVQHAGMQPPRRCADFSTQAEAHAYAIEHGQLPLFDRDGDGQPCERLP